MGEAKRINTGTHFMMGNQACTEGVIAAGCGFAAGYPITRPARCSTHCASNCPRRRNLLQTEDEIAAVCAAIGASWTGSSP